MPVWEPVIGLEVHVHLKTRSKIFCRCENRFGADPNTLVCPVCLGYPGTLPVLNARAVELAATLALALGCEVAERSVFAVLEDRASQNLRPIGEVVSAAIDWRASILIGLTVAAAPDRCATPNCFHAPGSRCG